MPIDGKKISADLYKLVVAFTKYNPLYTYAVQTIITELTQVRSIKYVGDGKEDNDRVFTMNDNLYFKRAFEDIQIEYAKCINELDAKNNSRNKYDDYINIFKSYFTYIVARCRDHDDIFNGLGESFRNVELRLEVDQFYSAVLIDTIKMIDTFPEKIKQPIRLSIIQFIFNSTAMSIECVMYDMEISEQSSNSELIQDVSMYVMCKNNLLMRPNTLLHAITERD